jgi:hypothetical protein
MMARDNNQLNRRQYPRVLNVQPNTTNVKRNRQAVRASIRG